MKYLFIIILSLFVSCSSPKIEKINWKGKLIEHTDEINYLFWRDGNQFSRIEQDSITVKVSGFDFDGAIFLLLSLKNETHKPFNFFMNSVSINYKFGQDSITINPSLSRNLEQSRFSFINTVIEGTGTMSRLFLNLPVDMLFKTQDDKKDKSLGDDYESDGDISKKILIGNHTLFPNTQYSGFMVFEYESSKFKKVQDFNVKINISENFHIVQAGTINKLQK